jgi:FixJ family two-component response regulator
MPGMSGLDMQDALISRGAQIPIIFITAFPDGPIRERAEAAGAIAVLEKPFDSNDILRYLEIAFGRARLQASREPLTPLMSGFDEQPVELHSQNQKVIVTTQSPGDSARRRT